MSYLTSPALSREAKYIIKNISENDSAFIKLFNKRFYTHFENEILFFIRDSFSEQTDSLKDFTKTLNALSITSPNFRDQNKLLLEIMKNKPAFSGSLNNILYENKNRFTDTNLISPLLDAQESGNMNSQIFEILSKKLITNESSDKKILDEIVAYGKEKGHNKTVQKFFKYFVTQKAEHSVFSDEIVEKYVSLKQDTAQFEKEIQEEFALELEEVRLMNKIYSGNDAESSESYISLLNMISEGKSPPNDFSFPITELAGDLVQIAINEPHLEKKVIQILDPLKNHFNNDLNPLIYYSTTKPKIINHFLEDAKKSDNLSADKVSRLVTAAYFNEAYKDEFLNVVAKSIRNTASTKDISPVFANAGKQVANEDKETSIGLFDKDIQYLMKTALYESKMKGVSVLSFAEDIKKRMSNEIACYYLADAENDENIASFNKFIKMAIKSPLINESDKEKNHFLASLYVSEQTVCLPPEAKQNICEELQKHNLQNGDFLRLLVGQCAFYEKDYNEEINTLSPYELYDNTFSLIEKNLSQNKLNNKDKEMIYQSLSKIENHESYNKDKFIKLINILSTNDKKDKAPSVPKNYKKER